MDIALKRLAYTALRHTTRLPHRRKCPALPSPPRKFHTTPTHRAEEDDLEDPPSSITPPTFKFTLSPTERSLYNSLPRSEQAQWRTSAAELHAHMSQSFIETDLTSAVAQAVYETSEESPHVEMNIPRIKPGLMSMGEVEEQDSGEDEEFEGDDITALGHGELEQHREIREYARIAAWEMPLLSKLAKPFEPPKLDEPLRFRYTTYMGENHPAQKKIVLEFCTNDLRDLTEAQRVKLVKLAGPRYNPETDVIKMSSEMFETQAQNKRYLGDLVDTLIAEAKDESDMFEDVPLDFRHHKFKTRPKFPEGWKLGRERRERLEDGRRQRAEEEGKREEEGTMVVGSSIIEEAMRRMPVVDASRVLVDAQQGKRNKGSAGRGKTRQLR